MNDAFSLSRTAASSLAAMSKRMGLAPGWPDCGGVRTWAGLEFDPARFDRPAANAAITRMLANGWIK